MGNLFSCCLPSSKRDNWKNAGAPLISTKTDEELESKNLKILKVNPLILENGRDHRTSKYELMNRDATEARLVIRRGQEFYIYLTASREYDPENDKISLAFNLEGSKNPTVILGTLVTVPVLNSGERSHSSWQATAEKWSENNILIKIITKADAMIGKWQMAIDTRRKESAFITTNFVLNEPFYLLFNPWCPDDTVYLEKENEREEYVLNDNGQIWNGTIKSISFKYWDFAQFENNILECTLYLLTTVGEIQTTSRNDPVLISRHLSAVINSNDDDGVLWGKWNKDYSDGTSPSDWMGSKKILQDYFKTKKTVKYGQCWVFGGVLATVCRAIGLPCRVVTNYLSAHDTNCSLTIDILVDDKEKDITLPGISADSIWDFHVWNEVWMKRPDLGPEYNGWQALDATPQEESENKSQCGPASVVAIKRGEIHKPYDVAFIFSEINADVLRWRYCGPSKPLKYVNQMTEYIGQYISTKAVGSGEREDLTNYYKYSEASKEERDIMLNALRQSQSSYSQVYLEKIEQFTDVKFIFDVPNDILIGQPLNARMNIQNDSVDKEYTVNYTLRVDSTTYNQNVQNNVKKIEDKNLLIKPKNTEVITLPISWDEYSSKLMKDTTFKISCTAKFHENNHEHYAQQSLKVKSPDIMINIFSEPIVGYQLKGTAEFYNPLPVTLKQGDFIIDGPGLDKQLQVRLSQAVQAGEIAKCPFSMVPNRSGNGKIFVNFRSKQLSDVCGIKEFMVKSLDDY